MGKSKPKQRELVIDVVPSLTEGHASVTAWFHNADMATMEAFVPDTEAARAVGAALLAAVRHGAFSGGRPATLVVGARHVALLADDEGIASVRNADAPRNTGRVKPAGYQKAVMDLSNAATMLYVHHSPVESRPETSIVSTADIDAMYAAVLAVSRAEFGVAEESPPAPRADADMAAHYSEPPSRYERALAETEAYLARERAVREEVGR